MATACTRTPAPQTSTAPPISTVTPTVQPTTPDVQEETPQKTEEPTLAPEAFIYTGSVIEVLDGYNPNTGKEIYGEFKPIAVMIENTSAARPHSGITQADIVYEMLMEGGGVTRLMAIYTDDLPQKSGPVRSARIPFLQMLNAWQSIAYVHFGGSTAPGYDIGEKIPDLGLTVEVDGLKGAHSSLFKRDSARSAPHNAYIDLNQVQAVIDQEAPAQAQFLLNVGLAEVSPDAVTDVKFNYYKSYEVSYQYNQASNTYKRFINGKPMVDREGSEEQVEVSNVIIQFVDYSYDSEYANLVTAKTVGSGQAQFLIDGRWIEGSWEREDEHSITLFYDDQGKMIRLRAGKTWIDMPDEKVQVEPN